jgi:O-antigen/teichoic acid export membrane protein
MTTPELLTGTRLLTRSALWNLVGQVVPVPIAILVIPHLIRGLGIDRFGVLSLAWIVVGYFSLFDLGLGVALTRLVSERIAARRDEEVPALIWTSLLLMVGLGVAGAAIVLSLSPWLVRVVLKVPAALHGETLEAFRLLALSLPIVTGTAGLAGTLAAQQRFDLLNAVRLPLGAFTFIGPWLALPFSHSLVTVVAVLIAGRLVAGVAYIFMCLRSTPMLTRSAGFQGALVTPLLGFGGWMTVTGVVGPLMVYLDRFLIGALISVAAVAYYTTPYDLATRAWLVSTPVTAVLFPAFAASSAHDRARTARLFARGIQYVFLVLFPLALALATLAREGLAAWLGQDFAQHSTRVLQWISLGVFVNGVAQLALTLIQGAGRPELSARLHLIELPFYLAAMWWLIRAHGIEGAAIAWVARATVDAAVLFLLSHRLLRGEEPIVPRAAWAMVAAMALLALPLVLPGRPIRLAFLGIVLGSFGVAAWKLVLSPARRSAAARELRAAGPAP